MKTIRILTCAALLLFCLINPAYSATLSILWDDSIDSSGTPSVDVSSVGSVPFSLLISPAPAEEIFNLQFTVTIPGLSLSGSPVYPAIADGGAVPGSWFTGGGINPGGDYLEFSADFGATPTALGDGILVSGLFVDIPDLDFGSATFSLASVVSPPGLEFNPLTVNAVPIPGSILLLGSGLIGLIGLVRRKRS